MSILKLIQRLACLICQASQSPKTLEYQLQSSKKISNQDLYSFLIAKFPHVNLWLSDAEYTLCHYDDVAYFLAMSQIDKLQYKAEELDCDDFAAALWGEFSMPPWSGLAVGYLWTEFHALNCIITEDMKLFFLEPQTDELSEQLAPWQGTKPRLIIV